jgi:hypothetical protein
MRSAIRVSCLAGLISWVFLPVTAFAGDDTAWELAVTGRDQAPLARISLQDAGQWCLIWNHSVQGFPVLDCFTVSNEQLTLQSTQTPDFAAGLGHISGRGTLESDSQHGYRIVDMDVPIPDNTLRLRVGSEHVNHRIRTGSRTVSLSHLAANESVEIRLTPAGDKGIEPQ